MAEAGEILTGLREREVLLRGGGEVHPVAGDGTGAEITVAEYDVVGAERDVAQEGSSRPQSTPASSSNADSCIPQIPQRYC
jgi:hypothetical protein